MTMWLWVKIFGGVVAALFTWGYLLPMLVSGGTGSLLLGILIAIAFTVALCYLAIEVYDELKRIMEKEK